MYDYTTRKEKILEVLNNDCEIKKGNIPKDDKSFTYDNGIRSWVGSIFIDIVNSSNFISENEEIVVAKILRGFTSEIISILNSSDLIREIGIRGDCVYGILSTPKQDDIYELFELSTWVNTFMEMYNKLLNKKKLPQIKVGIGIAAGQDLVIKAGQKGSGINDRIWIGDAVTMACKLANVTNRNGFGGIAMNEIIYINIKDQCLETNGEKSLTWFQERTIDNSSVYFFNLVNAQFNEWINKNI